MPSILGGIETRDKNSRKLYNIRDNSLKTCTFIFKENIDKNDFLDVIDLMNFSFNDFYIFLYEKNQLQFLNELNCFVKNIIYFSDEHLLSCLAKGKIELVYSYLQYYDNPNIGNYIIGFNIDTENLDIVYSAIRSLSDKNIFSYIDFKLSKDNNYYQNCYEIKKDKELNNSNLTLQLIVDKISRENLRIWNIDKVKNFTNFNYDIFKCNLLNPFSITIDENFELNLCPFIKGVLTPKIDFSNVLTEENQPTEFFKQSVEKDYEHYCNGCNSMLRLL